MLLGVRIKISVLGSEHTTVMDPVDMSGTLNLPSHSILHAQYLLVQIDSSQLERKKLKKKRDNQNCLQVS